MPINTKDVSPPLKEKALMPSKLETMDYAMFQYLNDELDVHQGIQLAVSVVHDEGRNDGLGLKV